MESSRRESVGRFRACCSPKRCVHTELQLCCSSIAALLPAALQSAAYIQNCRCVCVCVCVCDCVCAPWVQVCVCVCVCVCVPQGGQARGAREGATCLCSTGRDTDRQRARQADRETEKEKDSDRHIQQIDRERVRECLYVCERVSKRLC